MKYQIALVLFFLGVLSAPAIDQLRIKATKQLASRQNTGNQNVFGGHTSLTQKEYVYRFDVLSVSPQLANPIKLEWVVMFEDWSGRLRPGTHGTCETNAGMTKAVSVETDTVHLNQRNWQGPQNSGKIEDKIAGYGLRVNDSNGNLIAEQYEPAALKKQIDWKMVDAQPNDDGLKALQSLLGGGQQQQGGGQQRPPPPGAGHPRHP